ncbi:MAG TPA: DUF222 domain-containing protein [Microlunatus sp.]|nr:DUF222 domain-containing protein [Microlunatus sp.]
MAAAPVIDLDPRDTLAGLELLVRRRRAVEIDDLLLVGHWCDLQSTDPRDDPRPDPTIPLPPGSDRLVRLGGEGTPRVRELTLCELGMARGVHVLSARAVAADVLDLRHRLPRSWDVFLAGRVDAWLVRRVASMTRELSLAAVAVVDPAAAAALAGEAPGRVLSIVEAKVIEADPAAHQAKVEAEKRRRFVSLTRTDETGLRHVIARVTAGDAAYVDAVVSRVADILAERPDHADAPRDLLRSMAFGWLARPAELLRLLLEHTDPDVADEAQTDPEPAPAPDPDPEPDPEPEPDVEPELPRALAFPADLLGALSRINPDRLRPRAVLYVHLHEAAVTGAGSLKGGAQDGAPAGGVARVEGLGPHSLAQLTELLGHTRVAVQPVIDLRDQISVNRYEHPTRVRERIHLRHPGDVFPHACRVTRKLDLDHRIAYRSTGPPGQTGTRNGQPLGRTGHRAKTHLGYQCTALPDGAILWRSPHGLHRLVDHHGTHRLDPDEADALTGPDPIQHALIRLIIRRRARLI